MDSETLVSKNRSPEDSAANLPGPDYECPVFEWTENFGRYAESIPTLIGEVGRRFQECGLPLARLSVVIRTLHPQIAAAGFVWNGETREMTEFTGDHQSQSSESFQRSPVRVVFEGAPGLRRRLADPDCPRDFPILEELERLAAAMSLVVEAEMRYRVALGLLDTYVGERTGRRVLSVAIRRGMGETIPAVVWFSDLRGFTALTGTLGHDRLLAHLDAYFGAVGEAVKDNGGEILKFLGDGVLAIFEVSKTDDAAARCRAALCAADAAQSAIDALNLENPEETQIRWGLALDLGEVYYGNVGTPDRLDFTVIGTAVNLASRLEALAAGMGEPIVTSEPFAEALGEDMRDLGSHPLKGFAEPQAVFAPKS